ncbi:YceI family protein [Streptomyces sp. SID3343]|uniref:YceI family protein n=1 Tax=Streptomyces sp. SID3343 TaxID=2690260 RepID=UPI001370D1DD|nr:YceI family protein [Streptomyces sp. SID3343]MYW03223.1 polyisoprenoid-binding protein [Streptomyces sp. SID3343]
MTADTTRRTWQGLTIPTAGAYALDVSHTRVGFMAKHLMVTKVRGQFTDFSGVITIAEDPMESKVEATISAASMTTGAKDRDGHLASADFLEVEKYPTLEFRTVRLTERSGDEFTLLGELTIKGVVREVELKVELEGLATSPWGQEVLAFSASTEINREDFGMTWNQALESGGVLVSKKVKIDIEGEAVRQEG